MILKDELDALRETAAKAAALEATVASYKKRMEEHVDLRRQVSSCPDKRCPGTRLQLHPPGRFSCFGEIQ